MTLDAGTISITKTLQRIDEEWVTTTPKTRAGVRKIALPQEGVTALEEQARQQEAWRQEIEGWPDHNLVFTTTQGNPVYGSNVGHELKGECERLGIKYLTPHQLRHLHASLLLKEGLSVPVVSQRLGHANPNITLSVYAHVVGEQDKEAARAIREAVAP